MQAALSETSASVFLHVLHALHGLNVLSGVIMTLRVVKQPLHGSHFSVVQAWVPGQLAKWDVAVISPEKTSQPYSCPGQPGKTT